MARFFTFIIRWRKYLILILTPLILSPLPLVLQDKRSNCAYAIIIMAVYWTTEACSLAVTALLPLLLFPILGVVKAKEISPPYFNDTNALFVGGMLLAVAVEQWNLHKRIALKILLLIGTQPRRLLLGFMCPTAFLSMWVSNTATTAMMVPIAQAVLNEIKQIRKNNIGNVVKNEQLPNEDQDNIEQMEMEMVNGKYRSTVNLRLDYPRTANSEEVQDKDFENLAKATMLSIAYAANAGGTSTLTGTGTNLVLVGQAEELFPGSGGIGFGTWFIYAFPEAVILLILSWLWLQVMYLGINFKAIRNCFNKLRGRQTAQKKNNYESVKRVIQEQYDNLGPMTFAEKAVLVHFVILALLWVVRNPKFVSGWSALFKDGYFTSKFVRHDFNPPSWIKFTSDFDDFTTWVVSKTASGVSSYVRDATASIAVGFSLFNFPAKKPSIFKTDENEKEGIEGRPFPTLLEWKVVSKKFPWNIVFLLGGGFAMAKAAKESGLSKWLGEQLGTLESTPHFVVVLILCFVLCMFTEVTSNVATASIFLPIMGALAVNIHIHPWYVMVPATLSCSFAYMLPVATPPNAIVFSSGYLKVSDMAKTGFIMNIIAISVLLVWFYTFGRFWFDLENIPSWALEIANKTTNATNCQS